MAQVARRRTAGGEVRYDVRTRIDGRVVTRTFRRRKDADDYAATIEADKLRGVAIDPRVSRLTAAELAAEWLDSNPAKRPDTRATDEYHLRAHLLPAIGRRPIASVTPAHIQGLVKELDSRLAARTVRRALGVLRAMFAYAVAGDLLVRSPYRRIKLPRVEPRARRVPSADELSLLVDAIPESYQTMIYLAAVLGLRFSEIAGLSVRRVDMLRATISVAETVTRDAHGCPVFGPPKSEASRRTLAVPPELVARLARHFAGEGRTGADGEALVFAAPEGGPLRYANWRNRVWLPACRASGLEGLGFHDLRRANATALVHLGVDVKTAQTRLGHSDVRLTIGLYAQAESASDRDAANRLGGLFMRNARDSRAMDVSGNKEAPNGSGA
jgi:integrase